MIRFNHRVTESTEEGSKGADVLQYRVSKYDPSLRDSSGAYRKDDWTSVDEIGMAFSGELLTTGRYVQVENAYTEVAVSFLEESGVESLVVRDLESKRSVRASVVEITEGTVLGRLQVADATRRILREDYWCRLESDKAFLHFGYDYYMYVGVSDPCPATVDLAQRIGLFVESYKSPHTRDCS